MTDRPALDRDHYLDALALARATLRGDDAGLVSLINSMDVAMTFQAMTQLYLMAAHAMTGSGQAVDQYLGEMQRLLPPELEDDQ